MKFKKDDRVKILHGCQGRCDGMKGTVTRFRKDIKNGLEGVNVKLDREFRCTYRQPNEIELGCFYFVENVKHVKRRKWISR